MSASAFSFQKDAPSGQTLYYNITGDATVTVVNPGWGGYDAPTGVLEIPATVENDGVTYNVTAIGQDAFSMCIDLTGVIIPEGVLSLGSFVFYSCISLVSISLPSSLTEIRSQAFYGTGYITDEANWDSTGVLYIGDYLIACRSIADSVLTVREGTQGLGFMSVYYNQSIKKVYMAAGVRFIGGLAFADCVNLDTVQLSDSVPPMVQDDSFDTVRAIPITMKVPCGSGSAYRSHAVWRLFNIVEYGCSNNPDDPDNPHNPDDPDDPDNPNNPDNPHNPDNPIDPDHPNDPTDPNDDVDVWTDEGGLVIHVSEGAEIYVFDIDAHVVFHTVATSNVVRVPLSKSGVYAIRREGEPFPVTTVWIKR